MGIEQPQENSINRSFERHPYKPHDYTIEISPAQARRNVERGMPSLVIKSIKELGGGLGSHAYIVNGEHVVRFARHEGADKSQRKEALILPRVAESVSLPIPRIEYFGTQEGGDLHFMVYRILPGRQSERTDFISKKGIVNEAAVADLARFFQQMHAFSVEEAAAAGAPIWDAFDHFRNQLEDAREVLYPFLAKHYPREAQDTQERIERVFADYLGEERNMQFTPAVLHGDLEAEHVLFDPKAKRVSGIIDFGGVRIFDPDYDLWRPYSHYGKQVMDALLEYYPHPDHAFLYRKMESFWKMQTVRRSVRRVLMDDMKGAERLIERMKAKLYE